MHINYYYRYRVVNSYSILYCTVSIIGDSCRSKIFVPGNHDTVYQVYLNNLSKNLPPNFQEF